MLPKFISLAFIGTGVFILIQVIMPILDFKLKEIFINNQNIALFSPQPNILGVTVENSNNFPAFTSGSKRASLPYDHFTLSIPKINLKDEKVVVETNDFDQNLAQLPGTALPGEVGNIFITGHSSLPLVKNLNRAIFADLTELEKGDQILITASGKDLKYVVENIKIVDPKDISVINPPDSFGKYLTLMTCVPPGLYSKRLVVLARLI